MAQKSLESLGLLKHSDETLVIMIAKIKKAIGRFLDPEVVVEKMREIIDKAPTLDFRKKRNRRNISPHRPVFILAIDKERCKEKLEYEFVYDELQTLESPKVIRDYDFISSVVYTEVITKFTDFLYDLANDDTEFQKLFDGIGIDFEKEELKDIKTFLLSTIFRVTIELEDNAIQLEYIF